MTGININRYIRSDLTQCISEFKQDPRKLATTCVDDNISTPKTTLPRYGSDEVHHDNVIRL